MTAGEELKFLTELLRGLLPIFMEDWERKFDALHRNDHTLTTYYDNLSHTLQAFRVELNGEKTNLSNVKRQIDLMDRYKANKFEYLMEQIDALRKEIAVMKRTKAKKGKMQTRVAKAKSKVTEAKRREKHSKYK